MVQGIRCKYLIESVLVAYFLEIRCLSEIYAAQCISLPWFFFCDTNRVSVIYYFLIKLSLTS